MAMWCGLFRPCRVGDAARLNASTWPHALSAQRRPLADPLGLQPELLARAGNGPVTFADMVAGTSVPVVARVHALHLIWHRRLGIDLAAGLGDDALAQPRSTGTSHSP
jgi:hypothetical protein